ncbi:hypothetical protein P7K49_015254 [Saguinus oedipus]|uniref:Uncharacterized protein n=1 Tax=Saguinus oedipus TaxID=9490 RepID=A0ABQ9V8R1_SAGOE|nr:hypothetical protein P7K49_015254 [Saguinus oedipus]
MLTVLAVPTRQWAGRICACPGRDRKADEDHYREQQALNDSTAKNGAASKRAFKQSPPAVPALGASVKKRRHGDEDTYYLHELRLDLLLGKRKEGDPEPLGCWGTPGMDSCFAKPQSS